MADKKRIAVDMYVIYEDENGQEQYKHVRETNEGSERMRLLGDFDSAIEALFKNPNPVCSKGKWSIIRMVTMDGNLVQTDRREYLGSEVVC